MLPFYTHQSGDRQWRGVGGAGQPNPVSRAITRGVSKIRQEARVCFNIMFLKKIFSFLDLKDIRIRICLTHIANNFRYRQNQKPNIIEFQYLMSLCQDEKNCIFYRRILTGDSLLDGWQLPPYPGYPVGWLKYFSKLYFTHFLVD